MDGVERLRAFNRIIIHPRCLHTLEEFQSYSYKVDKNTNLVLPQLIDKDNHAIDAIRYAITPLIKGFKLRSMPDRDVEPMVNQTGQLIRKPQSDAYARQQFAALGTNWMNNL